MDNINNTCNTPKSIGNDRTTPIELATQRIMSKALE